MEKLNVDTLFPTIEEYERKRLEYIADFEEYVKGYSTGIFRWRSGYYQKRPGMAAAKWAKAYPNGFEDWREKDFRLTYTDAKVFEIKINELVEIVNKLTNHS